MNELKDRVEQRLEYIHRNKSDLASAVGESSQNITNWLRRGNIPHPKRENVADFLQCSVEWLTTGVEPAKSDADSITREKILSLATKIKFQRNLINLEKLLNKMIEIEKIEEHYED